MSTATPDATPGFFNRHLKDLLAGCAIAGLLLPEAVAYANIGNVPPQAGIIALLVGLVLYGVIGNSRFAVVSSTSSSAAVLAAVTLSASGGDPATRLLIGAGIVIMTGLFFLAASAARLGNMSDFIAKPVLRGFTFGLAITIVLKQVGLALQVSPAHSDAPRYLWGLLQASSHWHIYGGVLAIVALVILSVLKRWPRMPATLIVIVLAIGLGYAVNLSQYGIAQVGHIDLAHVGIRPPDLDRAQWLRCGELAFAMMLITYAESYGSIRGFALKHDDPFSPNRDLAALGASNLFSGLLGGMPVGAGYSATSANEAAGAQSRVSAWGAAVVIALMVALLLPQIALIPEPVLAAIVIHAVGHTIDPRIFAPYLKWRRDRFLVLGACLAVLLLGVLDGLLLAIAVSLLWTLRNLSEPVVSVLGRLGDTHDYVDTRSHQDAQPVPGMLIVRPEAPLFFANVERVLAYLRTLAASQGDTVRYTIISLEESGDIDGSSIEALQTYAAEMARDGRRLVLARLKPRALRVLTRATTEALPPEALHELSVDVCVRSLLDAQKPTQ
ncbi:SulP family inorganic anion transporter [Paraburkholderia adhaesiva]|uniref:SulP family inorganic anion transporter n=1 Tax=Paraburkholderia adhaesiva TaxID=2883244 RepID=UPI001F332599|nr:SulP family inorganic anion transporter [Paraburkholderia adhaesiva]